MAAGIPLFADDAVHQVPLLMGRRPRGECLLHQRVEPFLRVAQSLTIQPSIWPSALARRSAGSSVNGMRVWYSSMSNSRIRATLRCRPAARSRELDRVAVRKVQVDRHK